MNHIHWGIIGCGRVVEKKSGPAFNLVENSSLAAVMGRDETRVRDFARRHDVPQWFTNAHDLIHAPEVNAVYIATPPGSHAMYTIEALQAGKPVYVEKPMALNYHECQQMAAVSQKTGVPLFAAYYFPSLPYFLKIKKLLPTIGSIAAVSLIHILPPSQETSWRLAPSISGGGYFFDIDCHAIQLLDFLFGPIVRASGEYSNRAHLYAPEDTLVASLHFESGVLASCCWCYVGDQPEDRIEVFGTEGRISFSLSTQKPIELYRGETKGVWQFEKPNPSQLPMIERVVKSLLGTRDFPSNLDSAVRTAWAMDRIMGRL